MSLTILRLLPGIGLLAVLPAAATASEAPPVKNPMMSDGAQNRSITSMRSGNVFASQAARQRLASMTSRYGAVINMTSFGLGEGEGDSSGLRADLTGEGASMAAGKN